jgi:hypothetical protein
MPDFPTPQVQAHFASKAYTYCRTGENDAQFETRLALPDGWKVLKTDLIVKEKTDILRQPIGTLTISKLLWFVWALSVQI